MAVSSEAPSPIDVCADHPDANFIHHDMLLLPLPPSEYKCGQLSPDVLSYHRALVKDRGSKFVKGGGPN
jgi:hypothetical protein